MSVLLSAVSPGRHIVPACGQPSVTLAYERMKWMSSHPITERTGYGARVQIQVENPRDPMCDLGKGL